MGVSVDLTLLVWLSISANFLGTKLPVSMWTSLQTWGKGMLTERNEVWNHSQCWWTHRSPLVGTTWIEANGKDSFLHRFCKEVSTWQNDGLCYESSLSFKMLTLKSAIVKMSKHKQCDQAQCFYNCPSNKVPWMPEVLSLTSGEKRKQRSCTGRPETALAQAVK